MVWLEPGISYSALPMYLGELAPKNLRGTLGAMTEVFVIVGVFLAQIFSLQAVLGNPAGMGSTPGEGRGCVGAPGGRGRWVQSFTRVTGGSSPELTFGLGNAQLGDMGDPDKDSFGE